MAKTAPQDNKRLYILIAISVVIIVIGFAAMKLSSPDASRDPKDGYVDPESVTLPSDPDLPPR